MNTRAKENDILKFRSDRNLLDYPDNYIAAKMGVHKGEYSKYINGRRPITKYFITRFYLAFGDELSAIETGAELKAPESETKLKELAGKLDVIHQICHELNEKLSKNTAICVTTIKRTAAKRECRRSKARKHIRRHNYFFRIGKRAT